MKLDQATVNKDRLMYARIMIEVTMNQELPENICFENEKGIVVQQDVKYEWRPTFCEGCKGLGHSKENCKNGLKNQVQRTWRPKKPVEKDDADGFQKVHTKRQSPQKQVQPVTIDNSFAVLVEAEEELESGNGEGSIIDKVQYGEGEGEPPTING